MNRDDIIRMAQEANRYASNQTGDSYEWHFIRDERFFHAAYAAGVKSEQDRCCGIIFGMAGSDNVAQRTVDAIRGKG